MVLKHLPLLLVVACASPPKAPPSTGEIIALAVALDGAEPKDAGERLRTADRLASRMHCRGHRIQTVASSQLDGARSLPSRIARLQGVAGSAPWVAVAELHPRYQNPSAGRFRWEVAVRLAVASSRTGAQAVSDSFSLPALLTRSNQGASDALDAVMDAERGKLREEFCAAAREKGVSVPMIYPYSPEKEESLLAQIETAKKARQHTASQLMTTRTRTSTSPTTS